MKAKPITISIVGTGNVANNLARAFYAKGIIIHQIVSRHKDKAVDLAASCDAIEADFNSIDLSVDAILLCVKDDAIKFVASQFDGFSGVLIHTSGCVSLDMLSLSKKSAVLYPFVSMVKGIEIDFEKADIYIEGNNDESLSLVNTLAMMLSNQVAVLNSPQRASLHLSAVFAQNFTNHLMIIANDLLHKQGLDFDSLRPLLASYFQKLSFYSPAELQTGPAIRQDSFVIDSHLAMLADDDKMKCFYELFTSAIQQKNK